MAGFCALGHILKQISDRTAEALNSRWSLKL